MPDMSNDRSSRAGRLAGKVAIVTGVGGKGDWYGTGRATAVLFAREGAKVVVVDIDDATLAAAAQIIGDEGGDVTAVRADVSRSADCARAVHAAIDRWGRLDIVVNNCGVTHAEAEHGRSVLDANEASWDRLMEVNLKSVMLMGKHAIPQMADSGGGSIINTSSVAAVRSVGLSAYAASKGAVVALTQDMCLQHGRAGIRVNCIMPGSLYTPMAFDTIPDPTPLRKQRIETAPLGTEGTAWDYAWAALFLASDESRWISGVTLPIDGGYIRTTLGTRFAPTAEK
jgi:NAD(P)-dependent dehydrogenase (short-subunit alcohol dehydrogenase family)